MQPSRLNFAHLCDNAFLSQEGKLNIIGIFENISSTSFPFRHPKITLVVNFHLRGGNHPLVVRIVQEENQKKEIGKLSGNIACKKVGNVGFINEFQNIEFLAPGKYAVEIWIDNEPAGDAGKIVFDVLSIKKMLPKKT